MTTLSVVIPATDAPETLSRCLAAIRAAVDPPEEIIVVEGPAQAGPAEARNMGAAQATQDVVVFVDADVAVAHDVFSKLRSDFQSRPELAALFGSYDDAPTDTRLVSRFRNLLHHHVHQSAGGPATTFWAGLGGVRREDFAAVGGFDPDRFPRPSVEDIDFGMRLSASGRPIELDPDLQGKHLKRWTLLTMARTDLFGRGAPWVRLLLERGSGSTALNLGWRNRLSVLASLMLVAGLGIRNSRLIGASVGAIVVLNSSFYLLLLRRGGWRLAAAGVPLHVFHHLLSAAAVPTGAVFYLHDRFFHLRSNSP